MRPIKQVVSLRSYPVDPVGGRVQLSPERGPTACSFRALHCSCTKKVSWGAFLEPARFAPADSVHDEGIPVVSFSGPASVHRLTRS
jgi:hypothetical protein